MRLSKATLSIVCAITVAAASLWVRPNAVAQQNADAAEADTTPTIRITSQLKILDVTATDSNGQAVHGLQSSDFTILEDGKPQAIRNFDEISSRWVDAPRYLPANTYTSEQQPSPSPAINILLLDLMNEGPADSADIGQLSSSIKLQQKVKSNALRAIQNMPTGTRIAVLAMTDNMHMVQSFTSDRALLSAAINEIPYYMRGYDGGVPNISSGFGHGIGTAQGPADNVTGIKNDAMHSSGSKNCDQENSRNQSVLEAFSRIAVDSTPIKGRKNLIWFTTGIPDITDPSSRMGCLPDYSVQLSHAYDMLTAAQVSIYPIDVRGPDTLGTRQLSEQAVAEATGGVAFSESNDIASLVGKAIEDGSNYYSLSYIPSATKNNGFFHKIEVKVNQPGVRVVYRKGYYADDIAKLKMKPGLSLSITPPPAINGDMKAPMSRGLATASDILFDVSVEPSTAAPKPGDPPVMGTLNPNLMGRVLTRYRFQYSVPVEQISFKDGSRRGMHDDTLGFDIAVYDANDRRLTGLSQTMNMSLKTKTIASKQPIQFTQLIDLPPGQLFLRVGVLDQNSDKTGTLELPLKIVRHRR